MNSKATLFLAASLVAGTASAALDFGDVEEVVPKYDYSTAPTGNARCALVSIAMDESGSMQTEQQFMQEYAIPRMTNLLYSQEYQYDHVFFCSFGFGYLNAPAGNFGFRELGCTVGVKGFSGGYANALHDSSVADWQNAKSGDGEDSYNAIIAGVDALPESIVGTSGVININQDCGVFNKNFILVTDEDRDNLNPAATIQTVRAAMANNGYILNEVVNVDMAIPDTEETIIGLRVNYPESNLNNPTTAEGDCVDDPFFGRVCKEVEVYDISNEWFSTNVHRESGHSGAWTTQLTDIPPDGFYADGYNGNSPQHYVPLIQETRGAIWSIRPVRQALRDLDQVAIEAFAEAFIDIKVNEIDCVGTCVCLNPPCRTTEVNGDPHITTWRNEHYEYHGQCDLVMLKNPSFADGMGIDVQIRTKIVRFWSYIKNVAIRIGNDIIEIEGNGDMEDPEAKYWVNYEYQGDLDRIAEFPVTHEASTNYKRIFKIDLGSKYPGEFIKIQVYKEFVAVKFSGGSTAFGTSVGLLGDYYSGKTLARDGETVLNDFAELGHEWQVLPSEPKLFHAMEHPQFPEKCLEPEDPRGERRRRLAESGITIEQAEEACKTLNDPLSRKDCVYDVLATQDLDMIGAF
ncbi:unnamed protein product [Cylindrotheca closterium]|uniref:VWFD domain-containing protein n=1 Tax=Cylindrotheca closterium TaxID=2856 RepID=A0AAD2GDL6_9STRA|nr:unnamed protein product [Cylindrotheca closterium]